MWFILLFQNRHKIVPKILNFSAFSFCFRKICWSNYLCIVLFSRRLFSCRVQPTTHMLSSARSSKFWLCSWPNSHVHFDEGRGNGKFDVENYYFFFFCYNFFFFFFVEGRNRMRKEKRFWVECLCVCVCVFPFD